MRAGRPLVLQDMTLHQILHDPVKDEAPSDCNVFAPAIPFFGSSRNRVGSFLLLRVARPLFFLDRTLFPNRLKLVTMREWANSGDSKMFTRSPALSRWPKCGASSVTPGRWSSRFVGAEKNALWGVRTRVSHLLRPTIASRPRRLLWRQAGLPQLLRTTSRLPPVWRREARAVGLVGGQPALHQAVRLLCRKALPREHRPGNRRGTAPALADGQGSRQAVHEG